MTLGNHIVLIVSERIGDAIFCIPAIRLLRMSKPKAQIDLIALSGVSAQVYENNPSVDFIYRQPSRIELKKVSDKYDTVIDLYNSCKTKLHVKWLGNKNVFVSPRTGDKHQSLVATEFIKSIVNCSVEKIPERYVLYPQKRHFERGKNLLLAKGVTFDKTEVLIGCHMGCSELSKSLRRLFRYEFHHEKAWPIEKFNELFGFFSKKYPFVKFVLTGTKNERKLLRYLSPDLKNAVDLLGETSVLELAALMKELKLFLTGDTGALHIAVAMRIPIVVLHGPTIVSETGPYPLDKTTIIIEKEPLRELGVESVAQKIMDNLRGG